MYIKTIVFIHTLCGILKNALVQTAHLVFTYTQKPKMKKPKALFFSQRSNETENMEKLRCFKY